MRVVIVLFNFYILYGCTQNLTKNKINPNVGFGALEYVKKNVSFGSYYEYGPSTTKITVTVENRGDKNIKLKIKCKGTDEDKEITIIKVPPKKIRIHQRLFLRRRMTYYCKFYDMISIEKKLRKTR